LMLRVVLFGSLERSRHRTDERPECNGRGLRFIKAISLAKLAILRIWSGSRRFAVCRSQRCEREGRVVPNLRLILLPLRC